MRKEVKKNEEKEQAVRKYRAETPRYDLLPGGSLRAAADTMRAGLATHIEGDWQDFPAEEHFNRMLEHWTNFIEERGDLNELHHFLTRAILTHARVMLDQE